MRYACATGNHGSILPLPAGGKPGRSQKIISSSRLLPTDVATWRTDGFEPKLEPTSVPLSTMVAGACAVVAGCVDGWSLGVLVGACAVVAVRVDGGSLGVLVGACAVVAGCVVGLLCGGPGGGPGTVTATTGGSPGGGLGPNVSSPGGGLVPNVSCAVVAADVDGWSLGVLVGACAVDAGCVDGWLLGGVLVGACCVEVAGGVLVGACCVEVPVQVVSIQGATLSAAALL